MANNFNDIFVLPYTASGAYLFGTFDYDNFKCESPVDYKFRHEETKSLGQTTVRGVVVRYVNIGQCEITFTATGMYSSVAVSKTLTLGLTDPTSTGSAVKNKRYYGGYPPPLATADGNIYLAYFGFNPTLTDFDYQISFHMDGFPSENQFKIESVYVIGDTKDYPL